MTDKFYKVYWREAGQPVIFARSMSQEQLAEALKDNDFELYAVERDKSMFDAAKDDSSQYRPTMFFN